MAGRNPSILAVGFKDGGATDADLRNETVAEIGGWAQLVTTVAQVAAPNSAPVTAPNPTPDTALDSAAISARAPTLSAHAPRSSTWPRSPPPS